MKKGVNSKIMLVVLVVTFLSILVLATPLLDFSTLTPANNTFTNQTTIEMNFSIIEAALDEVQFNWNGTNYTLYNDSLVLILNFDNVSSLGENATQVFDASTYQSNGTVVGAVRNDTGKFGGAFNYDGVNDYIQMPNTTSLNSTNTITIMLWEKTSGSFDVTNTWGMQMVGRGEYGDPRNSMDIRIRATGDTAIFGYEYGSGTNENSAIGTTDIADGLWHHITAIWNGSTCFVFVDGVQEGNASCTNTPGPFDEHWIIGKSLFTTQDYFNGSVDEVRILNRSLSDTEVYQYYASNLRKYDTDKWELYVNRSLNGSSVLPNGEYTFFASSKNTSGNENITGTRTITVDNITSRISFIPPTLANATTTTNTSLEINVSINETHLEEVQFNWNGTNYTLYNDSLIVMYNFDNVSALGENNTIAVDVSSSNINASIENSAVINTTSCKYHNCMQFDGSDDFLNVSDVNFGNAFTIGAWINPVAWGAVGEQFIHNVFCDEGANAGEGTVCFRIGSKGQESLKQKLAVAIFASNSANDYESTSDLSLNVWQQGIVSWNGTHVHFYIDGVLDRIQSASLTMDNDALGFLIGSSPAKNREYEGILDNLFVFNKSISDAEAYQFYVSNLRKYDTDKWELFVNQSRNTTTSLHPGNYTFYASVKDSAGNENITETREVKVNASPDITFPKISFTPPTLANASTTLNNSLEINVSINETNVSEVKFNWNGTNYTMYNDSLVLMYNFNNVSAIGDTSTLVKDVSKYGNDGDFENADYNSSGKYGTAAHFDSNDFIIAGNDSSLDLGGNFTLSAWAYVYVHDNDYSFLITKDGAGGGSYDLGFKNSKPYVAINDGAWAEYVGDAVLTTNEWHHIVGVRNDTGHVRIYVDGMVNKSFASTKVPQKVSTPVVIGRRNATDYEFVGMIDEVRIWNVSLNKTQVYQEYISNLKKVDTNAWELFVNQSKNTTTSLDDGNYTFYASAKDAAGNENVTETREVVIDTFNPKISIITPSNHTNSSDTGLHVNYTASDTNLDACWYKNGTHGSNFTLASCTNITSVTWEDGKYNVTVYGNDTGNKRNSSSVNFTVDSSTPRIAMLSPENNRGDTDGNITFNFNVTDTFAVANCSLIINEKVNQTNTTITKNTIQNFTVSNVGVGGYNWSVNCTDNAGNRATNTTFDFAVIPATQFSGNSTNLDAVNISNIPNLIIDQPKAGQINFTQSVDLSNNTDINTYVNITFNSIVLNSTALNHLNRSAELILHNLTFTDPVLQVDGSDCPASICTELSYAGGSLRFNVTHFTTYSAKETPSSGKSSQSSGGGSSSSVTPQKPSEVPQCITNADCSGDLACWNDACVKLFDVKIVEVDSIVQPGSNLDFMYFVKGMAEFNDDVTAEFWLEKEGERVSSGSDTFYLGSFEGKSEATSVLIPKTIPQGLYTFYVQVGYKSYQAKAHRTIQVSNEAPLHISLLNPLVPRENQQFNFSLLVSLDESISVPVQLKETLKKNGNMFWENRREFMLQGSQTFDEVVGKIPSGSYQLEVVGQYNNQTALFLQSFSIGKPSSGGMRWSLMGILGLLLGGIIVLFFHKQRSTQKYWSAKNTEYMQKIKDNKSLLLKDNDINIGDEKDPVKIEQPHLPPSDTQVIVEGWKKENWLKTCIDPVTIDIPKDTKAIKISDYMLDLFVPQVSEPDSELPSMNPIEGLTQYIVPLECSLDRPRIVLTRDGRIFYDKTILKGSKEEVDKFLHEFKHLYGSFDHAFHSQDSEEHNT
jgi:hypothetical protein